MTLVRPAPLVVLDVVMQVNWIAPATIPQPPDDICVIKFHVSTAMRTAVSTHTAEILRDAGAKVESDIRQFRALSPDYMFA